MTARGRSVLVLAALIASLGVAAQASAHAYLIKTVPAASGVLNAPPSTVALTYDEAVEPRFAIISVTDARGTQVTTGRPARAPANPDTLVVPLRAHLPEGWYLVYWRAISVDGHPVQGAFTYAVGPSPGPAPQFPIPHLSATAATPQLLAARWAVFLSIMAAVGLFAMRMAIARPISRRMGASLRPLSIAFTGAALAALIAAPVYLDVATANDSLRSPLDLDALVPLFGATAFGRGYLDLELCLALFTGAALAAIWLDQPARPRRSLAEIGASGGALLAGLSALIVPGAAGHAAQTAPRGLSLGLDWIHLVSGSLWLGGLGGLLVLWYAHPRGLRTQMLAICVPRFSNVALASVLALVASGTAATVIHMPAVDALWETGYGKAILVKVALVAAAMPLAAINLVRVKPRLSGQGSTAVADSAARLLRGTVGGEAVLVICAIFAAAVLSSLAPPPPAFALQSKALATVGPGRVAETVRRDGYVLRVFVTPNRAAAPDAFALQVTKDGKPVRHASVTVTFNHLEMQMPTQEYQLVERQPGVYSRTTPALVMVGKWSLGFEVTPRSGAVIDALIVDHPSG